MRRYAGRRAEQNMSTRLIDKPRVMRSPKGLAKRDALSSRRHICFDAVLFRDQRRQGRARDGFAVDQEHFLKTLGERTHPFDQLVLICVAGELFERDDLGAESHRLAEDGDFALVVEDLTPQRVGSLEAGDENRIAGVLYVVTEVMKNAARLHHAVEDAMMITGPCRSLSFFESLASRIYFRREKPKGSSSWVRNFRASSS